MSMCIGKNNVPVIFAIIIMMNDDLHNITYISSLACINRGGKMIHNFCYSHLIMINTLYTSTVQVRVQYTVQYKVYYYYLLGSILFGGLAHCTVQSVSLIFARLNFIWGLKPPSPNDAPPL